MIMSGRMKLVLNLISIGLVALFVFLADRYFNAYLVRVANTAAIYVVAAVSYNLINGTTGQLSLGPNGFMAIGGYTTALLVLPVVQKEMVWFLEPLVWPFNTFSFPQHLFVLAVIIGGILAAIGGFIIGYPTLRLKGDYLAIATFGLGEIIFVLSNNLIPLTNGALGIKSIPEYSNLWWTWGWAVFTVIVIKNITNSSFGRAMEAVRENEVAAEAMGIDVFKTKLLAFMISAFFAGVSGGLLATLITTVSPTLFSFFMTFNLLIIIVLGGLGSITGATVTAVLFTILQELLRAVESPINIGPIHLPGISGMRMVIFAFMLIMLMLFFRRGLFGQWEFSWDWLYSKLKRKEVAQWQAPLNE
ncbi:MAG: branched-chain amino acid ABC transporter permease [Firmicutes bacterium]|nr:branched-chain amino acid ABC transporter permease [Bacillota bacterium]